MLALVLYWFATSTEAIIAWTVQKFIFSNTGVPAYVGAQGGGRCRVSGSQFHLSPKLLALGGHVWAWSVSQCSQGAA